MELVTRLGNKLGRRGKAHVTLIDRRRTHLWKPLLHEIAAGSMDLGMHEIDYLAQAYWHGFTFRLGALIGIDRGAAPGAGGAASSTTRGARSRRRGSSATTRSSSPSAA